MSGATASARLRVREPLGERSLELPLTMGGRDARLVLPGAGSGTQLTISANGNELQVSPATSGSAQLNGLPLRAPQALRVGDALALGAARILVQLDDAGALALDVHHLTGNDTAPPLTSPTRTTDGDENDDVSVRPLTLPAQPPLRGASETAAANAGATPAAARSATAGAATDSPRKRRWLPAALAAGVVIALLLGLLARLQTVPLMLSPADARVHADGGFSWQSAGAITLLRGERMLRAERAGYRRLERRITVRPQANEPVLLTMQKLPGILDVDSGGVAATALVDGAELGRVPGQLQVSAGPHTLLLRAERHFDAVLPLEVIGMGQRQAVKLSLAPSWGKLVLTSATPGASLRVNDGPAQPVPANVDLPAGVHRLQLSAAGAHDWRSSVLVKAGATTTVGPVLLGAPDAQLRVGSQPAGAAVTIGGVWRGRTPLALPLPPGARYEVLVSLPGYQSVTRVVDAQPGGKLAVDAKLVPIMVELRVSGEPADAELWIDGTARGKLPANLSLLAGTHAIEVRRAGMQTWTSKVDLAPGVPRSLEYRLLPEGRPAGWTPPAASITAKNGPALKLLKGGSFLMGSARREQGRRPNEGQLRVTLARPFYIGFREVTNAEFRRFRADHASGVVNQQSIDLDNQAVSNVTWEQAVEYCNWLSAQDGLPAAYESKDGSWVLHQPVNNGYRLPTEAEWEFAARMGSGSPRRFEWGDELPVPANIGNIAGVEAAKLVDPVLPAYRDDYLSVASVGRFAPNAFGLYDMTGNVSEWVHDVYTSFIDGTAVTDPLGPPVGARHTVRGSNWRSATISELRLAWRDGATEPSQDLGFRVARYAE